MKNPFLPNPRTHPRLYAREAARFQPVWLAAHLAACLVVGVPAALGVAWLTFTLVFGYGR